MDAKSTAGQLACRAGTKALIAYEADRGQRVKTCIAHTDSDDPALPDGLVSTYSEEKGHYINTAVMEAKTRYPPITYQNLCNDPFYDKRLLIDAHKLQNCKALAAALCCEFWSLTVFESEGLYLVQRIIDKWGRDVADYYIKEKEARKTINTTEKKVKPMAFISIDGAKPFQLKKL